MTKEAWIRCGAHGFLEGAETFGLAEDLGLEDGDISSYRSLGIGKKSEENVRKVGMPLQRLDQLQRGQAHQLGLTWNDRVKFS